MNVYSKKISTAIGVIGTGLTWIMGYSYNSTANVYGFRLHTLTYQRENT